VRTLASWKEIAVFLNHSEHVKRWERERGLPVHRIPAESGGVYAFAAELDGWLIRQRNGDDSTQ